MLNPNEVIAHFVELQRKVSSIEDPDERHKVIIDGLNKYTISQWCEVGEILFQTNLI